MAVLNTYICWTVSVLVWMVCDVLYYGKPGILGAVQAMITGKSVPQLARNSARVNAEAKASS